MLVQFLQNLGGDDARQIKAELGVSVDHAAAVAGAVIELDDRAAEWLGKKYPALFESADKPATKPVVKAEAKKPELTAPAK